MLFISLMKTVDALEKEDYLKTITSHTHWFNKTHNQYIQI